jgi:hypothetical protein
MRLFEQGMELKYAGRPASHIDQGRHGRLPVRVLPRTESDERKAEFPLANCSCACVISLSPKSPSSWLASSNCPDYQ